MIEARILHVSIPFKNSFSHALKTRTESGSIFLSLRLEDGTVGYGESLPREYVTGETPESVIYALEDVLKKKLLGASLVSYGDMSGFLNDIKLSGGAARCALELALLDVYGKHFKESVNSLLGRRANKGFYYSGVIGAGTLPDIIKKSLAFKIWGLRFVKIKVGTNDDIERLKAARCILGRKVNIRVDANCAWGADAAIDNINKMRRYGISAVEQPVKADNYSELKKVTDSVPEIIIADESLCTVDDAYKLAQLKACNMFNIRISKCGGLLNSLRIAEIALSNNMGIQLGCQVGESGLLSAAGWHFASTLPDIYFCEGSYGRFLLKEDATKEDMTIGRKGKVRPIAGNGLGVNISDEVINKYLVKERRLS